MGDFPKFGHIYAFQPLYAPIAPIVFYSGATLDSIIIISAFFYSNKTLMRITHCVKPVKCDVA